MEEIEERHQRVRELVESQFPGCRVTEIEEHTQSTYTQKHDSPDEYVLARVRVEYSVEAISLDVTQPHIKCRVAPNFRGEDLLIYDVTMVLGM